MQLYFRHTYVHVLPTSNTAEARTESLQNGEENDGGEDQEGDLSAEERTTREKCEKQKTGDREEQIGEGEKEERQTLRSVARGS